MIRCRRYCSTAITYIIVYERRINVPKCEDWHYLSRVMSGMCYEYAAFWSEVSGIKVDLIQNYATGIGDCQSLIPLMQWIVFNKPHVKACYLQRYLADVENCPSLFTVSEDSLDRYLNNMYRRRASIIDSLHQVTTINALPAINYAHRKYF